MTAKSEKNNQIEKKEKPVGGFWNGVQNEEKRKYVKTRTTKARKKAQFAGVLYFLGTFALAVLAFMPLVQKIEWRYGELWLATFWMPFADIALLWNPVERAEAALNLTVSLLYAIPLLVCVFSAFYSLAKLDNLFMKGNRRIGYNQNYLALKKMGNAYSAAYAAIAVCSYCMILLSGVDWTYLFYFSSVGFLLIHFISGMVGGTVSRFSVEKGFLETPRKYGLFSVFFRNLMQFAAITGILYFFVQSNIIPVVYTYLTEGFFAGLSSATFQQIMEVIGYPVIEILAFIFIVVIWRHAINPTEYDIDGPKAKGRKTVRVASFIAFILVLSINAFIFIFAPDKNLSVFDKPLLYVAAILLALFVLECLMRKCPLMLKKYRNVEDPEPMPWDDMEEPAEQPVAQPIPMPAFCCPLAQGNASGNDLASTPVFDKLGYGGVYVQPDGSQVLVMPVLGNAAMLKPEKETLRMPTAEELRVRAIADKWIAAAKDKPQVGFDAAAYVEENRHLLAPVEIVEEPEEEKEETEWQVKCPKCGALHNATKTDITGTCKSCGERFELPKWKRFE